MQDPFGSGLSLVLGSRGLRTPCLDDRAIRPGFTTAPEACLPLHGNIRRMAVEAQERDPQFTLNKYAV